MNVPVHVNWMFIGKVSHTSRRPDSCLKRESLETDTIGITEHSDRGITQVYSRQEQNLASAHYPSIDACPSAQVCCIDETRRVEIFSTDTDRSFKSREEKFRVASCISPERL